MHTTYIPKHVKQPTIRRRARLNNEIIITNISIKIFTIWLMIIASFACIANNTFSHNKNFDFSVGTFNNKFTLDTIANTTTVFVTPTNIVDATTNPIIKDELTSFINEDTIIQEESESVELITDYNEETPPVEEEINESTTQPVEEATIEEENAQWWTDEDYQYLLMIIVGEAQNCSRQEQMYVGSVVLNRLHSSWFPKQNTIKEVATAKGQYACMWDGNAYKTPTETNKEVALELLNNGSVLPENVVFQAQFKQGNGVYCQIGKTYFCYK